MSRESVKMAFSPTRVAALVIICMFAPVKAERLLPGYHAYHDGNYYVFSTSGLNWHDARDACADQGGHLVEIGSGAEQEFLEGIIAQIPGERHNRWIGFNDLNEEGHFVWENTERSGFYRNWHQDQPDNYLRPGYEEAENCALLWRGNKWNDEICSREFDFIYEV